MRRGRRPSSLRSWSASSRPVATTRSQAATCTPSTTTSTSCSAGSMTYASATSTRSGFADETRMSWRIRGTYFESCNCEAICPCRRIDGVGGGRSTHGECLGVLSWAIDEGEAGEVTLDGLKVALATRYHDDEPGSPWSFAMYVDARADAAQRDALE